MRLQAEMENFRKRQTRRAEEAAANERERLLLRVLPVADNIARALSHSQAEDGNLRQGIELINRELQRFLESEGVTPIEAVGQPFDPTLHEAIGTRPANVEPDTVVDEVETGYKLGDKLLRPARVVVAAA
jgi:molecular chaperone GrpE